MEPARQLAQLVEAGGELLDRSVEQLGASIVGGVAQAADREQHRRESLLRAVVEVALDAPALCVGDLDETRARGAELRLVALPVGDVPQVARERRRSGKPDPRDRQLDREL